MLATLLPPLRHFCRLYYGKELEVKTQPFYFPFTEPSLSLHWLSILRQKGCHLFQSGWIELLGCGMIHPNVLHMAGIDPQIYTGFCFGAAALSAWS